MSKLAEVIDRLRAYEFTGTFGEDIRFIIESAKSRDVESVLMSDAFTEKLAFKIATAKLPEPRTFTCNMDDPQAVEYVS